MKILFASSEVVPFAKTGGLADVAGALPLALEALGEEVIIVLPRYKAISGSKFNLQRIKEDISYSVIGKNIKVYFIEENKYFDRDGLYQDKTGDYKDNLERFCYYCARSLELLKEIHFRPDIIHVNDWQTCLIPVYLKTRYAQDPFFKNTRTVLTVHNIGYQGLFPKEEFPTLGLDWGVFTMEGLEYYGKINILKGGLEFSDLINTVSPTYALEIRTKEFGFGLEGVLNKRRDRLFGILNGLDYKIWNPETDPWIAKNFSLKTAQGKLKNKEDLQKICRLPVASDVPLVGIVSRLAQQKGFDILAQGLDSICRLNLQLVILGTGDLEYHQILKDMVKEYPKVISLHLKFDDCLAHKIYAGSDIFLMPSKYEPCGLGQMISFRYGTLPLVFKTGGLADTVSKDNGFVFEHYTKEELIKTITKAIATFKNKEKWKRLAAFAMQRNFSWEESAKKYLELYVKAKSL
ncbi:MAG: glycogen synthase GlgA [Candidatus Omnitrophota bacterium]